MNASPLRPAVADLVYHLYDRPLHPELFDTLAKRRIRRQGFTIDVRITPTGHALAWEQGRTHLSEVMAAADAPLPSYRALFNHRLRGEHAETVAWAPGLNYQTSFQVEQLPEELFRDVHEEILRDGLKKGLLHNFRGGHRLELAPLGYVTVESWGGNVLLSSFHTFPDERTVVKTQSLIEKRG